MTQKQRLITTAALASLLALGACEDQGPNQTGGTVIGAATGGILGAAIAGPHNAFAGAILGAAAGGIIGNSIGKSLDDADRARMQAAQQRAYAAPIGQPIIWDNPNNGHSGQITPVNESTTPDGEYCREFQTQVTVSGQSQTAYGKACRQPDGSWKIINSG